MITKNDYERSILLSGFVKAIRERAEGKAVIDLKFTPVIGGYIISFISGRRKIRVVAEVKGVFTKRLIIKKYIDEKAAAVYKACSEDEIACCAECVLTE